MTTEPDYWFPKPANSLQAHVAKCSVVIVETVRLTAKRRYWRCQCGKTGYVQRH
jgi:hypothetical protein